jgi:hypothetical protein
MRLAQARSEIGFSAAIDEIQMLFTLAKPNIANWQTDGDVSVPNQAFSI